MQITKEKALEIIQELGLHESEEPSYPWWKRLYCRVAGPHQYIPVWECDIETYVLIETGRICEVCGKETV